MKQTSPPKLFQELSRIAGRKVSAGASIPDVHQVVYELEEKEVLAPKFACMIRRHLAGQGDSDATWDYIVAVLACTPALN